MIYSQPVIVFIECLVLKYIFYFHSLILIHIIYDYIDLINNKNYVFSLNAVP